MSEFFDNFKTAIKLDIGEQWDLSNDALKSNTTEEVDDIYSFAASLGILYTRGVLITAIAVLLYVSYIEINAFSLWSIPKILMSIITGALFGCIFSAVIFTPIFIVPFHFFRKRKKNSAIFAVNERNRIDSEKFQERMRIMNETEEVERRKEKEQRRKEEEQEEWQKQLDREIERERRLAEVRHESTLMAMQAQIKLYGEYKEKGLDIEKQIFDMRKNLIELEGQENKAMLDEVRQALDDLDT